MNNVTTTVKISPFRWDGQKLELLDQTSLPNDVIFFPVSDIETAIDAIKLLKVRGAPALGVAGALMTVTLTRPFIKRDPDTYLSKLEYHASILSSVRPTAVNLKSAIDRVTAAGRKKHKTGCDSSDIHSTALTEAERILEEDRNLCEKIGKNALPLIKPGSGILTHCNAGALATAGIGTATAPLYLAHSKGIRFSVFADETRPLLQGARLTAWELSQAGIDVTLICDNMAAALMAQGRISLIITGADRIAANGDTANKTGTLGLAVLARHFNIPFYIAAPSTTLDPATRNGEEIPIELRDSLEITFWGNTRTAPEGIRVHNPAFDITPGDLITGIITEDKIYHPPFHF